MYIYIYIYVCMYVCVYIYIYIYIFIKRTLEASPGDLAGVHGLAEGRMVGAAS